jgi:Ca-activated chloride channel family protein
LPFKVGEIQEVSRMRSRRWTGTAILALAAAFVAVAAVARGQEGGVPAVTEGSLMFRSPVTGRYERVPLRHTDVWIDVRGLVAAATVTQQYENDTGQPLEAVYVFPLPHEAAVYDMEARIGDRVIKSVIQEREEAKRTYEAARQEGKRAALLEQERPNVFTASLANVMPGDKVEVKVRYVEALPWEDGRIRLTFPMVVGPRYIPGTAATGHAGTGWAMDTDAVPDASRITPPVRHPDSRPGHDIALAVRVEAGAPLSGVESPSHPILVSPTPEGHTAVRLAAAQTLPNRDFVLEMRRAPADTPRAAAFVSPRSDGSGAEVMVAAFPPSAQREDERPPLEMLFLIDVSGSMAGTSIEQARTALLQGLDRLRAGDRFNVVAFDDSFRAFRPQPVAASAEDLEAGRRFVRGLAPGGGTEMLPALEHLMAMPAEPGFLRYIVLLTDGCLGNEEQIFASLRRGLGGARLFTVAIGSAPNHHLATKMAEFGRGSFSHIADAAEINAQMGRLLDQIESPVLTDLSLHWDGVTVEDVYPSTLPDLFLGRPLVVFGRITGGEAGVLRLEGTAREAPFRQELPVALASSTFHPGITTLWARARVEDLLDSWRRAAGEEERAQWRDEVVKSAIRYNLVTRFTSLVAVEERVVNPGGEARTALVPTELPAGWQMDKVFGANPAGGTADLFLETAGAALLVMGIMVLAASRRRAWVGGRR